MQPLAAGRDHAIRLAPGRDGPTVGLLSVLMGIGGGSLGAPIMTLHGMAMHRAVATAAGFGLLIALPSVMGFLLTPCPLVPRRR